MMKHFTHERKELGKCDPSIADLITSVLNTSLDHPNEDLNFWVTAQKYLSSISKIAMLLRWGQTAGIGYPFRKYGMNCLINDYIF